MHLVALGYHAMAKEKDSIIRKPCYIIVMRRVRLRVHIITCR